MSTHARSRTGRARVEQHSMNITVAGRDRTADLGAAITAAAVEREKDPRCAFLPQRESALSLGGTGNVGEYLDCMVRLIRAKNHVLTLDFDLPRRRGLIGAIQAWFRRLAWRLLRYQHDRITFRQNLINSQLVSALEFCLEEIRALREREARREGRGEGP